MGNSNISGVDLGLLVGMVPTVSMLLSSWLLTNFSVSPLVEGIFQNFAAGLILAAVASELFPLMLDNVTESDTWIGVTVGFALGLSVLNGLEYAISSVLEDHSSIDDSSHRKSLEKVDMKDYPMNQILEKLVNQSKEPNLDLNEPFVDRKSMSPSQEREIYDPKEFYQGDAVVAEWDEEPIQRASVALLNPDHRQHLNTHIYEVIESVRNMENKVVRLFDPTLTHAESESLSEEIDEQTHLLQYKLDHCRRLLQGSESEVFGQATSTWMTEQNRRIVKRRLDLLKLTGEHLIEHLQEEHITSEVLKEMHQHITDMDRIIISFHESVEQAADKWTRRQRVMPEPALGAIIPVGLVVPVALDCFSDGFLIGVTCALSPSAGFVLGVANCLEMGFLGMAYSVRIKKCTGSTWYARQMSLIGPPLFMFLSSGLGAYLADQSRDVPAVFVGFVAFGVVALVSLVCEELLIEAKETQGENSVWYVQLALYAAIYLVIMMNRVL